MRDNCHGPEWIYADDVDVAAVLADVPLAEWPAAGPRPRKRHPLDILCAFDIETSPVPGLKDQAAVYHWQMQLGFNCPTIYGRELAEARRLLDRLADAIPKGAQLVIYAHNLYYEFAFMRGVYPGISSKDVFAVEPRHVVRWDTYGGRIVWKCSYILCNMGLNLFTHSLNVPHAKEDSEEYDHTKIRYPWSPLTPEELRYCRNDVLGLIEALAAYFKMYGDTVATVPLTSTGFLRRDVKRAMLLWSWWALKAVQPTPEVYVLLNQAFRGGNTHANRYYVGHILEDVGSFDRCSSYPDVLCNRPYPMGAFRRAREPTPEYLRKLIKTDRAVLARIRLYNVRLRKPGNGCPYLSHSKTRGVKAKLCNLDNGRILFAPGLETTVTDLDFQIIDRQYKWDKMEVLDLYSTHYGYLPDVFVNLVIKFFVNKTSLKNVQGQEELYTKSKNKLNSAYGLCAQDPCKVDSVYDEDHLNPVTKRPELWSWGDEDIEGKLAKDGRQPYKGYQWGVWCTAWARYELQTMIDLAGRYFVYADTDSVKYVGNLDVSAYNTEHIKASKYSGAYADDPKGITHYMGTFDDEGRATFVTWGAKKYATIKKGKLEVTVSGVSKKYGALELLSSAAGREMTEKELKEMDPAARDQLNRDALTLFKPGYVWHKAGGTEAIYNDTTLKDAVIDGNHWFVGPNIYLKPSTYKLGITDDYDLILQDPGVFQRLSHRAYVDKYGELLRDAEFSK